MCIHFVVYLCKKNSVAILYVPLFLQCNVCVVALVDERMKIKCVCSCISGRENENKMGNYHIFPAYMNQSL